MFPDYYNPVMDTKYIIVTGGVLSGLGKGISSASIGQLLSYDYKVVPIKCDGYLNVDPGTMNPVEHGEVFVLDDGTEVDMDFGHYERFLRTICGGAQNLTMGRVFEELREKERNGDFKGKTVQLVPHAANHIIDWWKGVAESKEADVVLIEIGGTVGDMENELYLEAARRLRLEYGPEKVFFAHLTYVPIPAGVNEQKSKPTQQSVANLMERGLFPGAIICRGEEAVSDNVKRKISEFSNISPEAVFSAMDVDSVYKIPQIFNEQGIVKVINKQLGLDAKPDLTNWNRLVHQQQDATETVRIAICGKYTALEDSYASVVEALSHAGAHNKVKVDVTWVDTEAIENGEQRVEESLTDVHGVIVPGGFGTRGIEGKISVIKYIRENNIPFLGLCYGLQLAVIETARSLGGKSKAHTTEANPETPDPVIDILPEKKDITAIGGTLRKGAYPALVEKGSLVHSLYGRTEVSERHRHRFEVNPDYHEKLKDWGLRLSGMSPDGKLAEFIERSEHPYFVATQAHPELKSALERPAPLFNGLVAAVKRSVFGERDGITSMHVKEN
ncbi:MAG: CTP synthase [Candidatus Woesearchaeota archaeon]